MVQINNKILNQIKADPLIHWASVFDSVHWRLAANCLITDVWRFFSRAVRIVCKFFLRIFSFPYMCLCLFKLELVMSVSGVTVLPLVDSHAFNQSCGFCHTHSHTLTHTHTHIHSEEETRPSLLNQPTSKLHDSKYSHSKLLYWYGIHITVVWHICLDG